MLSHSVHCSTVDPTLDGSSFAQREAGGWPGSERPGAEAGDVPVCVYQGVGTGSSGRDMERAGGTLKTGREDNPGRGPGGLSTLAH